MSVSPRINFRISDEIAAALKKRAAKDGISEGVCARKLLAKALGCKQVETLPRSGRPKNPENS